MALFGGWGGWGAVLTVPEAGHVMFSNVPSLMLDTSGCCACDEMGALLAGVFCGVLERDGISIGEVWVRRGRQGGASASTRRPNAGPEVRGTIGGILTAPCSSRDACCGWARPW